VAVADVLLSDRALVAVLLDGVDRKAMQDW